MSSEQPDFTQNEWLQREAHGDPKLMELLTRRELIIDSLAQSQGSHGVEAEPEEFAAVVRAIQRRKTELGIPPLNEL